MAGNNPFLAGVEQYDKAYNTAAGFAVQSANLQIQKQRTELEQQQIKQIRDKFNAEMGKQLFQDFGTISQMKNGPLKKQQLEAKKQYYQQAGIPIDESWWAGAEDPQFQVDYANLVTQGNKAQVADPEGFNMAMAQVIAATGNQFAPDMLSKSMQGFMSLQRQAEQNKTKIKTTEMQTEAMKEATRNRIETTNVRAAQRSWEKGIEPIRFILEGANRAVGIIENYENAPEDKKIQLTKQIKTVLANEEARLVTGKANFGEGTAESMAVDTYATRLREFMNKLSDDPNTVISGEQINQLRNFYDELSDQYMGAADRLAESMKGGRTPEQIKSIEGAHDTFKETYKKKFGRWPGEEKEAPVGEKPKADVQLTPAMLESYRALKEKLDKASGPARARILSKIQTSVPLEIRKKLGLQ